MTIHMVPCIDDTIHMASYTYPHMPSSFRSLGTPSRKVLAYPGCVWILTLMASNGHRAMSAKNSAEALAARYSDVLHRYDFSWKRREFFWMIIRTSVHMQVLHKLAVADTHQFTVFTNWNLCTVGSTALHCTVHGRWELTWKLFALLQFQGILQSANVKLFLN